MAASAADESAVRHTVSLYFAALHQCDGSKFDHMWHPDGKIFGVQESEVVVRGAAEFRAGATKRGQSKSDEYTRHDKILCLIMLGDATAAAKVQIALPPAPDAAVPSVVPTLYTDWLVLLRDQRLGWRVMSKIFSPAALHDPFAAPPLLPADFAEVAGVLWDGYRALNRAGRKEGLMEILHESAQISRCEDSQVCVESCAQFVARVHNRWEHPQHKPYKHLQADSSAASADRVLSIDFAGPGAALAQVRVGAPPLLSTELHSLLKVNNRWRIVAKTSYRQPFLVREARETEA